MKSNNNPAAARREEMLEEDLGFIGCGVKNNPFRPELSTNQRRAVRRC